MATIGSASRRFRFAAIAVVGILLLLVPYQARLQRFETLSDTEYVSDRVRGSVNMSFFEAAVEHPLGRGLGSAVGTSIPYFLEDIARPQYGMENEYARLCLEEGIPGVVLWIAFVLWALLLDPRQCKRFGGTMEAGAWSVCVLAWFQAAVGTGLLASVPGTMLLLVYMGVLGAERSRSRADSSSERAREASRAFAPANLNA